MIKLALLNKIRILKLVSATVSLRVPQYLFKDLSNEICGKLTDVIFRVFYNMKYLRLEDLCQSVEQYSKRSLDDVTKSCVRKALRKL